MAGGNEIWEGGSDGFNLLGEFTSSEIVRSNLDLVKMEEDNEVLLPIFMEMILGTIDIDVVRYSFPCFEVFIH